MLVSRFFLCSLFQARRIKWQEFSVSFSHTQQLQEWKHLLLFVNSSSAAHIFCFLAYHLSRIEVHEWKVCSCHLERKEKIRKSQGNIKINVASLKTKYFNKKKRYCPKYWCLEWSRRFEYHNFLIYQKLTVYNSNLQLFGALWVSTFNYGGSPLL